MTKAFEEKPMDVARAAVIRLQKVAMERIQEDRNKPTEMWWDGYLCAIRHILEMEDQ
jgi:hypothetical protein